MGTLPARHFAILWQVRAQHGGMTRAVLQRSRNFVRSGVPGVEVLTFDEFEGYDSVGAELRGTGELADGVSLVNLWDWLRASTPVADAAPDVTAFAPLGSDVPIVGRTRTRLAADGTTVLQVDHLRDDGSLLVSDRRDVDEPGIHGGRSVVLCDAAGRPAKSWGSIWGLYRFWLDALRAGEPAIMIVDSKTSARFMATYRRRDVLTVHVVHGSHLQGDERPFARLRATRAETFQSLEKFDRVVVLSSRQRDDIRLLLGATPNVIVVPVSIDLPRAADARRARPMTSGIMLSSLIARKRVDHAIEAVRGSGVTLDVYGTGVESSRLAELAQTTGGLVHLRGHDTQARSRLADHGFLVLASVSEGLPLVLTEAMAAGCIPIAYDVPYGPADIITDRVDGLLVKSGDVSGLRDAIAWLGERSDRELRVMRRAARLTAEQYGGEAVTRRWLVELTAAWTEKVPPKPRRSLVTRARSRVRRTVRPLVARVRASH